MSRTKSFSEIVRSLVERLRLSQPSLDTKPGTVSRDLFIDIQADELQKIYSLISLISQKQSLATASGRDLDRLAGNFGFSRKSGTPASGIIILSTDDMTSEIPVPNGMIISAKNGLTFRVVGTYVMTPAEKNRYAGNANRLRNALDVAGISDSFAIEVPIESVISGSTGNIGSYQIADVVTNFSLNATNINSFSGGTNLESDNGFKARFLASFSGSNTGTSQGYRNAILGLQGVLDALVVEPGNSLMLRDGTEVIQLEDSTNRIVQSGSGGKVDIYVLGSKLQEISESFIFLNKSPTGNISDDVNDHILGNFNQDLSLTSEERRYLAFKNNNLPLQPVSSVNSVICSDSGILTEAVLDQDGNYVGNYIIVKDLNPDTGGSAFGFDKIKFVNKDKNVSREVITKFKNNSSDSLVFQDVDDLTSVYEEIQIRSENSTVSKVDNSVITLNHKPIIQINRVVNFSTGEVYVVDNNGIDNTTGLNNSGQIVIKGKSLPSISDKLQVDYIWRKYYIADKEYNRTINFNYPVPFSDSVNWSINNGIKTEGSTLIRSASDQNYDLVMDNIISSVDSVYFSTAIAREVLSGVGGLYIDVGMDLPLNNVVSILLGNVDVYNTKKSDGYITGKLIFFPSDSGVSLGDQISANINKIEVFDIEDSDGSFVNNTISLSNDLILQNNGLLSFVDVAFLNGEQATVKYSADISTIVPTSELSSLPISGSESSNLLLTNNLSELTSSIQPTSFNFNEDLSINSIQREGSCQLLVSLSGIPNFGSIKITGTTFERLTLNGFAGNMYDGNILDLKSILKSYLAVNNIPENYFVGRVSSVKIGSQTLDLNNYSIKNNSYDSNVASSLSSLSDFQVKIPDTSYNNLVSYTSGTTIECVFDLMIPNNSETLFFYSSEDRITEKYFLRISNISVTSGLRSLSGILSGSISISSFNQPTQGSGYFSDYNFKAPKDGERISVNYNLNKIIIDSTSAIETVRPITADVIVKEAFSLPADVTGTIVVTSGFENEQDSIVENVSNAISNLLNTATLGGLIDYSDLISTGASIQGVDSIDISLFNESGKTGRRSFLQALDNQNIVAGIVLFTAVSRRNFRIS